MADFSNNNFVTQDTNYDDERNPLNCETYTVPNISAAQRRRQLVSERVLDSNGNYMTVPVIEYVYTSTPYDFLTNERLTDIYHTFFSSVDLETRINNPNLNPDRGQGVYSLADSSYQTRAAVLVPRAVGYSAGFIDHYFRGSIDARWARDGFDTWKVTITNTSAERIGDDATIESVFRTDPSYFGRSSSDDTGPILARARIADYVPGFAGLDPNQTVTISNISIRDLLSGDSVRKYDRRTVITGKLGNEDNAVIGLAQLGGSHKLRAEISWRILDCGTGCGVAGAQVFSDRGGSVFSAYWLDPFCALNPPDFCLTRPVQGLDASSTFTLNRTDPDATYYFGLWGVQGGTIRVTVKIYIDDELTRTLTQTSQFGRNPIVTSYP